MPKGVEINRSQQGNSWQGQGTSSGTVSESNGSTRLSHAEPSGKVSKTGPQALSAINASLCCLDLI